MTSEEQAIYFKALFEEERAKNVQLVDALLRISGAVEVGEGQIATIGGDPKQQVLGRGKVGWGKLRERLERRYKTPEPEVEGVETDANVA